MHRLNTESRLRGWRWAALVAVAVFSAGLLAPAAVAQEAALPQPPVRKDNPGVFESIGRFFDRSATNFRDSLQGAKRRMDDLGDEAAANTRDMNEKAAAVGKGAAEVTKDAVDAVTFLPKSKVMSGRERCAIAPNGAPDCVAAAEQLCRKNGYATGKSMDFTSAEECPAKAFLNGQQGTQECYTVTFISRAMCQ
jgi:hypothetical protein